MTGSSPFPPGFLWGAATSAYQIEGSPLADGAGESIWHRFTHSGRVAGGATGDVACDHYRRWREDVALMRELGLGAYRFSIAWGRVLPEGTGRVNQPGLDFYRRLVDSLVEAGIAPVATLYHWDLPAALDDRGGWPAPDAAGWFADYAAVCARALGGVALWATLNEPWVVADNGYLTGDLAPGRRSAAEAAAAGHNLLRAHRDGVAALRAEGAARVGCAVNIEPKHPASDRPGDLAAAARADLYMNRHYLDPLLTGRYPDGLAGLYGDAWCDRYDAEAPSFAVPLDWLGITYYTRSVVRDDPAAPLTRAARVRQQGALHTATDWEVYPEGLEETLRRVAGYPGAPPLYVVENGAALEEPAAAPPGGLDDPVRIAYLESHLAAAARAIVAGVDLRGYFVWSLLDNLEWSLGYEKRFGLVHVDYATLARTPKASARWYAETIASHGAAVGG